MNMNSLPLRLLSHLYGVYAVTLFVLMGTLAFVLVTLVPGLNIRARRFVAHKVARGFFFVAGIRMRVSNEHELPAGPCVVVANHASYMDGVVLKALLPARFSFVIKKEAAKIPLAGVLLRRIGSEFVDRFNRHAGAMDARRLIKAADAGQALVFFPEGTFVDRPGVGKFHTGAFAIAARAGLPIVPLAILGTRKILPSGHLLPRFGKVEIRLLPAISQNPNATAADNVHQIRDQARQRILQALGEPDLSANDGVANLQASRKAAP